MVAQSSQIVPSRPNNSAEIPTILLFGATASGKTAFAIELAQTLGGEIINADSRQIYQGLPIITAMPSEEEFSACPHHLFNFLDPTKTFSVAEYIKYAKREVRLIKAKGKIPIVCGGTGFYLEGLEKGVVPMPDVPEKDVAHFMKEAACLGVPEVYEKLKKVDPELAETLNPNDMQRVVRGISFFYGTGEKLSYYQKQKPQGELEGPILKVALDLPRTKLYERINQRFDIMLQNGVEEEVSAFNTKHRGERVPASKSVGVHEILEYQKGQITKEEMVEKVSQKMRQYAKRQNTWLRGRFNADILLKEPSVQAVQEQVEKMRSK